MLNNYNYLAQPLWQNGPAPGEFYNFTGGQAPIQQLPRELTTAGPYGTKHSTAAITTGSSVLGIRYDGGVMLAADTLVSYGSLARYQNIERVFKINKNILLGGSGDFADIQSIKRSIDQKMIEDQCCDDNIEMKPKSLASWMTRVLYNRRSRMNPLYIDVVVGGVDTEGTPYLANVDLRGRSHEDYVVATGFARHLAIPLVREKKPKDRDFTAVEASELIRTCMEVLFYRDTRNISQYTVGVCSANGCGIEGPFQVNENWTFAETIKGY
ncbi:proteasome subunit beta type-4 [Drosophila subpulchrella]|uniref:proteasome subunit beta type-4 n=1 Tax=Drosophila subpulchrella TaxID=1486046 RepID=UPI0018A134F4|nr:proteasome subunit beta type-4 [Drosophila subpulchrella]